MKKEDLTLEYLHECFIYDKENGELYWKRRPLNHFKTEGAWKATNTVFSGKMAGCITFCKNKGVSYKVVQTNGYTSRISHIIWMFETGVLPDVDLHHLNLNTLDNRFSNLKYPKNYHIKFRNGKYHAWVMYNYIGRYDTEISAINSCEITLTEINNGSYIHDKKISDSGLKGVYRHFNKFRASIRLNGKLKHIGLFNTAEEAHNAYLAAKSK